MKSALIGAAGLGFIVGHFVGTFGFLLILIGLLITMMILLTRGEPVSARKRG